LPRGALQELEAQIHAAEKKARWYNHKHDEALKAIVAIKPGLLSTFQKVGCSDDATLENVAATGITDGNIMQVLGIIEQRIAEIVQMNELALGRFARKPDKKRGNSRHGRGEASMLPSTLESSDSDSDDGGVWGVWECMDMACQRASTDNDVLCSHLPTAAPVSLATLKARTANAMAHKLAVRVECYRVGYSDSPDDNASFGVLSVAKCSSLTRLQRVRGLGTKRAGLGVSTCSQTLVFFQSGIQWR